MLPANMPVMGLEVVELARVQFALTIMFHYLFPPLSIGLGGIMVVMEARSLQTRDPRYEAMARFWTRIFAVNFAVGVASGIVMEFQFGTNWSTYSRFVGDVFGSALAAEGIFAFFLESGFLAVLVFGWDRVGPKMHFFATLMVFLGSCFSAVWIIIANSWQHTPAGYRLVEHEGALRAEVVDFWAMIFNPSAMHRLGHVLLGSFILGGFFVMSISAWYLLRRRHEDFARRSFAIGLVVAWLASCLELVSGHAQATAVYENQRPKLAAFEGHFVTEAGGTPLYLFGLPNVEEQRVDYGIKIPGGLSMLLFFDPDKPVDGLDKTPPKDRPPVVVPFLTYHVMVGLGMYFIGLTSLALLLWWRGTLYRRRWLLWVFVGSVIGPYVANQAGWVSAEVGRQPWVVYGLLRTEDAASVVVPREHLWMSIAMFSVIYTALFALWLFVINEKVRHGPKAPTKGPAATGGLLAAAASVQLGRGGEESMTASVVHEPQDEPEPEEPRGDGSAD